MDYKQHTIKLALNPKFKSTIETDLVAWSHDKKSYKFYFDLSNTCGEPMILDGVVGRIKLDFLREGKTIIESLDIESEHLGLASFTIPDGLLGYEGKVEAHVYLDYESQTHDLGSFSFLMKKSSIDNKLPNLEFYVSEWDEAMKQWKEVQKEVKQIADGLDSRMKEIEKKIIENDLVTHPEAGDFDSFRPKDFSIIGKLKNEVISTGIANADWFDIDKTGKRDSSNAINEAVKWLKDELGFGTLVLPKGELKLVNKPILWHSNLSLRGAGMGLTKILMEGDLFNAIENVNAPHDGSAPNLEKVWLDNVCFSDFQIDGSGLASKENTPMGKGIFILYMRNARFRDLWIHDTIGTGLGADFLTNTVIDGVLAERCGRNLVDYGIGQSGIGIGTGTKDGIEAISVSNCICRDNGNYGIFVETQDAPNEIKPIGVRMIGNLTTGNRIGIGNKGSGGIIATGNVSSHNKFGFQVTESSADDIFTSNKALYNSEDGFLVSGAYGKNLNISSNIIMKNKRGITFTDGDKALNEVIISNNIIKENRFQGLKIDRNINSASIDGNIIVNNATDNLAGNKQGVLISKEINNSNINNNNFSLENDSKQVVGIEVQKESKNVSLQNNNFSGLLQQNALNGSRLLKNSKIKDNLGLDVEENGSVLIEGHIKYLQITFKSQYSKIPNIQISTDGNAQVWVSNLTSLSFFIRTNSNENVNVNWYASI